MHDGESSHCILVVDDNSDVLAICRTALEANGFEVIAAASSVEAQRAFHPRVSLLLTDCDLGGGDRGEHLAHALTSAHPELRVLFMSGTCPCGQRRVDFLSKPFSGQELRFRVEQTLGSR